MYHPMRFGESVWNGVFVFVNVFRIEGGWRPPDDDDDDDDDDAFFSSPSKNSSSSHHAVGAQQMHDGPEKDKKCCCCCCCCCSSRRKRRRHLPCFRRTCLSFLVSKYKWFIVVCGFPKKFRIFSQKLFKP